MEISSDLIGTRSRNLPALNVFGSEFSQLWNNQFSALYMTNQPSPFCHTFWYDCHPRSDRVCTS